MSAESQKRSTKIWCVFSVDNLHDQPPRNLVGWFPYGKPNVPELAKFFKVDFAVADQDDIMFVVDVWRGEKKRRKGDDTDYRLELVEGDKWLGD